MCLGPPLYCRTANPYPLLLNLENPCIRLLPLAPRLRWGSNAGKRWKGNRTPAASINFITAHDGFTLSDLVAYNDKHNQANGENNNDGESHNLSWNCGAEGETDKIAVNRWV